MATQYCINQEISFLYIKETEINEQLYRTHLEGANKWNNTWHTIQGNINHMLTAEMNKHYENLNMKLDRLNHRQQHEMNADTNTQGHQFYPRTVNLTNINFTHEEASLLNKGLQHSIEKPIDKYWKNLIEETEQAIKLLDTNMQNPIAKRHTYLINNINNKLVKEDAIKTQADKGKTCVIIHNKEYNNKVFSVFNARQFFLTTHLHFQELFHYLHGNP
jgi:hypothetical protein